MQKIITLTMVLLMFGCAKDLLPKDPIFEVNMLNSVKERYNKYLQLVPTVQDKYGFVETSHCDALLFSSLLGTVVDVSIEAARDSSGAWKRRDIARPCYPDYSDSTISRDMFIGLYWYLWTNKRLDLAEDLFRYGQERNWIMGQGDITRTYLTPGMQGTLAEIIYQLGGKNHRLYRNMPQHFGKLYGYQAHLTILHIALRAELTGSIESFDIIKWMYERNRKNAFFSYVYHKYTDGNQDETMRNLLREEYFPSDRLPTNLDRADPWLWHRDPGKDWIPQPNHSKVVHSGGELLFIANMLFKDIKGE